MVMSLSRIKRNNTFKNTHNYKWDLGKVKEYIESLATKHNYRNFEDWYGISLNTIDPTLLHHYEAYLVGRRLSFSKGEWHSLALQVTYST
jgi:hypothetical protein